jgi:hypothetical protein
VDPFAQLVTDFQNRYGVRRDTAERLVDLFVTLAASYDEQHALAEFNKAILGAAKVGEPWTRDYFDSYIRTRWPQAPAIVAEADKHNRDAATALQAVYGIQPDAAAELAAFVRARG